MINFSTRWTQLQGMLIFNLFFCISVGADQHDSEPAWYTRLTQFVQHQVHVRQVASDLEDLQTALKAVQKNTGNLPADMAELASLSSMTLPQIDPWGQTYQYRMSILGEGGTVHLTCAGADKTLGTDDDLGLIVR